jgi:hypothetical protein
MNLESCEVIPIGPIGPLGECPVQSRPVHCISFLAGSSIAWKRGNYKINPFL